MTLRARRLLLFVVATLPLAACNKPRIAVYTAPNDATPPPASTTSAPDSTPSPAAPAAPSQFKWSVPADWKETKAGAMQQARFTVPEKDGATAEVAVSVFPSDTGGTLQNVNRWRGQIGLPPVDEPGLASLVTPLSAAPGAQLVDLANNDKRMLAAIVPRDGTWWFYKMTGGAAAVANARDAFIGFVSSKP